MHGWQRESEGVGLVVVRWGSRQALGEGEEPAG